MDQTDKERVIGYWVIDFEIDTLKDFLSNLKLGAKGSVSIVDESGKIIAGPNLFSNITLLPKKELFFNKKRIFYTNPLPSFLQIPWKVVTSIHENDFLDPVRKVALTSLLYGITPSLFFLILCALFFGRVSKRLKEIAWEMDEIGNLTFRKHDQPHISRIREINMMNHALIKMKTGLSSFSKYIPVDVVKKLLFQKALERGAEKKKISVFFVDLVGFTKLSEQIDPQQGVELLEEFMTKVTQKVHEHHGIIDKFIGDAVMALWGALEPLKEENSSFLACKSALAIRNILAPHPSLSIRIGINTGDAMVGNFGSEARVCYTAIGDTINISSRLEKLNKSYQTQILIGPDTAEEVKQSLIVRPLERILLEGKSNPILVYELLGEKENISEKLIQAVEIYCQGLERFDSKDFVKAKEMFERANELFENKDDLCKKFLEKCQKHTV